MIQFRVLKSFRGPNPYATEAGVLASMLIEDGDLRVARTRADVILGAFGAWFRHEGRGEDGRPLSLETPVGLADFLAALCLAALNEMRGFLRTASAFDKNGRVAVYIGCHHEHVTATALSAVVSLFNELDALSPDRITHHFAALWRLCRQHHPDYQAKILMQGAHSRGIPYLQLLPFQRLWQYGWGRNGRTFFESVSTRESLVGGRLAGKKQFAKAVFEALGAPVVPHVLVDGEQDLEDAARRISWPCVVKPTDRDRSEGVTLRVTDMPGLRKAFHFARKYSAAPVMIERHIPGDVHRILVVRGKVAWVIRRDAPHVIGDGVRTLAELVEQRNAAIAAAQRPGAFVGETPLDEDFHAELRRQAVDLADIVPAGRRVNLRKVPLMVTGAFYANVTDDAHPDIVRMAEFLADAFGFSICGIDFMTDDISRSYVEQGAVIEINTTPALRVPVMTGVAPEAVGCLVLGDEPGRIPVTLILCDQALHAGLHAVLPIQPDSGWVIGGRCGVGATPLAAPADAEDRPNALPFEQTLQVLRNPRAARILIVCDPKPVVAHGLPVDRCDDIICYGSMPDPSWRRVLERHSSRYFEVTGLDELAAVLAG